MPKTWDARVRACNWEVEFKLKKNSTGRELFVHTCGAIGLRESWYYGVRCEDKHGRETWVKPKKKFSGSKAEPMKFWLCVRFYPEHVEELIQDLTQLLFYYEVKLDIVAGKIYCPAETALLLASYQAVVRHGPYDPSIHQPGFLNISAYLPKGVLDQFKLTNQEWEAKIVNWYSEHGEMSKEDAVMAYLKTAQDLEMYGVAYFPIKNSKHTELWLGVDALGLNVYSADNKLVPKVTFPWSEIRKLGFHQSKFVVKPAEAGAKDLIFYCESIRTCKDVMQLCAGYYDLYARRRQPDSIEVQQMKVQAKEQKLSREREREKLMKERRSRELLEEKYQQMLRQMMEQDKAYENSRSTLSEYQGKLVTLETELEEERQARLELQAMQKRLEEVNRQLETENAATVEEYNKLSAEKEVVLSKIEEQQRIIEEVQLADKNSIDAHGDEEDKADSEERELKSLEGLAGPEDDREGLAATDVEYAKRLDDMRRQLDAVRDKNHLKEVDVQYEEHMSKGMDKYRTLLAIRQGNTKKRIEEFESM